MQTDLDKISGFTDSHHQGNIFQTKEMFEVYEKTKNYEPVLITIEDEGEISGVLLAVIQKEHSGALGVLSSRSIIWGGPLVKNNDLIQLNRILKAYTDKIKKKAIYTQFRNIRKWTDAERGVFEKNGFIYEAHLDIIVDLKKEEDELWKNIDSKGRNKIRGAGKAGTVVEVKNDMASLQESYKILSSVYQRAKLPLPSFDFFSNLYNVSSETRGLKIFTAIYEGKIIGCRLALVYKDIIYDFYTGAYAEYYNKYPNDVIPWEIFKWGKSKGYCHFDFGGAGKPNEPYGVRDYKMKFGGELVEYGRFVGVHKKILLQLGEFLMKIYKRIK
jgi:lipid II:glycine glycyltransferase (peptidoglycan interpeptide bridge formation enzyme)